MSTRTLEALVSRDTDGWWTIRIPELTSAGPGGRTITATGSATTWRGVAKAAHELASVWLDVEPSEVDVTVRIDAAESVTKLWAEGIAAEAEGRQVLERAALLRRGAVHKLRDEGYPVEAVAQALGVTRQRVQQLDVRSKDDVMTR
ncbi:hypothetical protein C5E10_13790 [Pseudoclavibacter sp. RFBG4]|uniref:hypothetical protein n=1 Tax=Pseudoclavibacter sp. RFBG4 TaxID=2080575 RepID=UPI000CE84417|nr:hypothetical protein [Pseudoclavibacter sp. RFBG4]PPG28649.1 hypothetical protein C5E10_13790 [Pseudoclavibacter sp. RFBG4]